MKNILKMTLILAMVIGTSYNSNAQVVMKDYLVANHQGKIEKSANNAGKPLYYKFEYNKTEGARINYSLHFYKDASMSTPWVSFPVLLRNLTWTYYMDISMTKGDMTKVFAMIFKKDLRWARVKYSPHESCAKSDPIIWERFDMVDDYEKLLLYTFMQLDKNVDLECYLSK